MLNLLKTHSAFCSVAVVFFLLSAGIGGVAYSHYLAQKQRLMEQTETKLSAIASMKVDQISRWRHERLADAHIIIDTPFIASLVEKCFEKDSEKSSSTLLELHQWMISHKDRYDYRSVALLDSNGVVRFSIPEGIRASHDLPDILASLQQKESPELCDLQQSEADSNIFMNLLVPFIAVKDGVHSPVGYLQLQIDPCKFLYPLVEYWPTPSTTAETMLVRVEGDEAVVLNELRYRKGAPFSMHLPLSELGIPGDPQDQPYEAVLSGIDYHGSNVLMAVKQVPDTSWRLITKIERVEVYEPLQSRALTLALLMVLLLSGAGATLGLIWSYQRSRLYLEQYRTEAQRLEIARRYEYLTRHANDIILLVKQDGGIAEANRRALNTYGYGELVGSGVRILEAPENPSAFEVCGRMAIDQEGCLFETIHCRQDGSRFPVEISAQVINPGYETFYLMIIRDITERKAAESALKEARDTLEQRVRDRTADLEALNEKLCGEVETRRRAEEELRALSVKLAETEESERRRLSRELHDRVGQNLTALNFNLTATMNQLGAEPVPVAASRLKDSQKLVEETISCVRDVMADLRPPLLDDYGLAAVLRWYCREFSRRSGIQAVIASDTYASRLPLSIELALFRIAQESLSNVMRHSRAAKVAVDLEATEESVRMSIFDNGVGFNPEDLGSPRGQKSGWGMLGMRERAEMAGGRLQVVSAPGKGTRIIVEVMRDLCL